MKRYLPALLALAAALSAQAERQPLSRYDSIVDRQMFGEPPPGFDPTRPPSEVAKASSSRASDAQLTKEQEQLKSAIRFSVINQTPDGAVEVGFTDNSDPKAPKHYFLKLGEEQDGWLVKEADVQTRTMTVVKNEIEVSLELGGDSGKGGGKTGRAAAAAPAPTLGGTLRGRRAQREALRQQEAAAAAERQAANEAARNAREAEERERREAEKAEMRNQLLSIQEELRRSREAAAKEKAAEKDNGEKDAESE